MIKMGCRAITENHRNENNGRSASTFFPFVGRLQLKQSDWALGLIPADKSFLALGTALIDFAVGNGASIFFEIQ